MRASLTLAVLLVASGMGCGKRGDPLPPLQRIPHEVPAPRVSQRGSEVVLVWQTPTGTVDGGALELTEAEVLRRAIEPPAEEPPVELPETGEEGATGEATEASETVPEDGAPPPEPEEAPVEQESADEEVAESPDQPDQQAPPEQREETLPEEGQTTEPEEDSDSFAPGTMVVESSRQLGFAREAKVIARIECTEPGVTLEYRDPWDPEWEGMRVEYAIRHVNRRGIRSENSPRSFIEPLVPFPAPSGLQAQADNGFVRLSWDAALEREGDEELEFAFNVYRRRSGAESYPVQAVNRQLVEKAEFEDRSVTFGRNWCYSVRRVAELPEPEPEEDTGLAVPEDLAPGRRAGRRAGEEGGRRAREPEPPAAIESTGSEEVCLTPIDTFAPAAPRELVAIGVPGGILLSWGESDASDLVGYRVYRAEARRGPFESRTPELVEVPSFTDQELTPGQTYFYRVSAVDGAEPPNESERSEIVSERAPE